MNVRAPKAVIFGVVLAVALTPAAILVVLAVTWTPIAVVSGPLGDALDAYESGDYATTLRLFQPLAERGDAAAQYGLGVMYRNGQGVPQDDAEAVKWYRLAAEQDFAGAQASLGGMYSQGHGVPPDVVLSYMWLNLAASRFPPGKDRDKAVEGRDALAKRMTPAQIAEAQRLAREWKPLREQAD